MAPQERAIDPEFEAIRCSITVQTDSPRFPAGWYVNGSMVVTDTGSVRLNEIPDSRHYYILVELSRPIALDPFRPRRALLGIESKIPFAVEFDQVPAARYFHSCITPYVVGLHLIAPAVNPLITNLCKKINASTAGMMVIIMPAAIPGSFEVK